MTKKRKAATPEPSDVTHLQGASDDVQPDAPSGDLTEIEARFDDVVILEREGGVHVEVRSCDRRYYTTRPTAKGALEHLHAHVFGEPFQPALSHAQTAEHPDKE